MKAIILAAGMGKRLGRYTKDKPKCMLDFLGKSLIERQVETLRVAGVNDIVIVRGYMQNKIQISGVKYYSNEEYSTTNMVETLMMAEEEMDDEILVCYSDILYEQRIIQQILNSDSAIGVTVDTDYWEYWKHRLERPTKDVESLIIDAEKGIVELGESGCEIEKARERYVGLIKFSREGVASLKKVYHEHKNKHFNKAEPWLKSKSFREAYMTCMLQAIINSGYRVDPIIISGGWLEFDTERDYELTLTWAREGTLGRFYSINA